jgi:hypothetical protein
MHSYILQDWITIRGASSVTVTQGESDWLDLAPYQDVMFYIDVREYTGTTPTIVFQTAPIKEDGLFQDMMTAIALNAVPANPTVVRITTAATPLARYLRWKLAGPASVWDATFRVLIAANALGL